MARLDRRRIMSDARVMLIALLLVTPFACSHPDRGPASPPQGHAGGDQGSPPAPGTTNEPAVPGVPNALNGPARDMNAGPATFTDSRTLAKSSEIAQPLPGTGGTIG